MKDKEKLIIITGPTGAGKTKIPFSSLCFQTFSWDISFRF